MFLFFISGEIFVLIKNVCDSTVDQSSFIYYLSLCDFMNYSGELEVNIWSTGTFSWPRF